VSFSVALVQGASLEGKYLCALRKVCRLTARFLIEWQRLFFPLILTMTALSVVGTPHALSQEKSPFPFRLRATRPSVSPVPSFALSLQRPLYPHDPSILIERNLPDTPKATQTPVREMGRTDAAVSFLMLGSAYSSFITI